MPLAVSSIACEPFGMLEHWSAGTLWNGVESIARDVTVVTCGVTTCKYHQRRLGGVEVKRPMEVQCSEGNSRGCSFDGA
jgi:hypothetical protein